MVDSERGARNGVRTPGQQLLTLEPGSFVRAADLQGESDAVRSALAYAARRGRLVRVRRGLYYKPWPGADRRSPSPDAVAYEVYDRPGCGPTGASAARLLGLRPAVELKEDAPADLAVLEPVPKEIPGVRLHRRTNELRRQLTWHEIAGLELIRDPAAIAGAPETRLDHLARALENASRRNQIRPRVLAVAARRENHGSVRDRLFDVLDLVRGVVDGSAERGGVDEDPPAHARRPWEPSEPRAVRASNERARALAPGWWQREMGQGDERDLGRDLGHDYSALL